MVHNLLGKRILIVLGYVIGIYLIFRAVAEPFLIDYSNPESYMHDWGGPTYAGVLIVHMGLGVASLVAYLYYLKKTTGRKK